MVIFRGHFVRKLMFLQLFLCTLYVFKAQQKTNSSLQCVPVIIKLGVL